MLNSESLSIVRAALKAWWSDGDDGPGDGRPADSWWGSYKDCWVEGWQVGYRAGLAAHHDGHEEEADAADS